LNEAWRDSRNSTPAVSRYRFAQSSSAQVISHAFQADGYLYMFIQRDPINFSAAQPVGSFVIFYSKYSIFWVTAKLSTRQEEHLSFTEHSKVMTFSMFDELLAPIFNSYRSPGIMPESKSSDFPSVTVIPLITGSNQFLPKIDHC
jgi:hypothetical protein